MSELIRWQWRMKFSERQKSTICEIWKGVRPLTACPITSCRGYCQTCRRSIDFSHILLSALPPVWYWHNFLRFLTQLCLDTTEADTLSSFSSTDYFCGLKDYQGLNVCVFACASGLVVRGLSSRKIFVPSRALDSCETAEMWGDRQMRARLPVPKCALKLPLTDPRVTKRNHTHHCTPRSPRVFPGSSLLTRMSTGRNKRQ